MEVHLFQDLVLAHITRNHLLDLLALEQETKTAAYNARVVRYGCQTCDGGCGLDLVNEGVWDTGEAEAAAEEGGV
jgi:hypothetical protein